MLLDYLLFRKKVIEKNFGNIASLMKNQGSEKEDFRKYQPFDDSKHINWKLSAKYNDLFVSLFKPEHTFDLHIFLDINNNRNIGQGSITNYEIIESHLSLLAERSSRKSMNCIIFLSVNDKIITLPLSSHPEENVILYKKLRKCCEQAPSGYISHLSNFLDQQKRYHKTHGVLIFSDFLAIDDKEKNIIKAMKSKNELYLFNIPVLNRWGKNFSFFSTKKHSPIQITGMRMYNIESV